MLVARREIITEDFLSQFQQMITSNEEAFQEGFAEYLSTVRKIREENGTYFWQFAQKERNARFDELYSRAIQLLTFNNNREKSSLIESHLTPPDSCREIASKTTQIATASLAGFGGWAASYTFYTRPMTNLILHEYGHRWANMLLYKNVDPYVSSNALYWLQNHEWSKWLNGVREGGPGNYTTCMMNPNDLTPWGRLLSPQERQLFILGGGLGIELIANTTIAGLGLLAIKKKRKALGAALIGASVVSHSAAHSYIRRYQDYSVEQLALSGGDPPRIAFLLADMMNCSVKQAYQIMSVSYALFPIVFLSALSFLLWETQSNIPNDIILQHMLTAKLDNLPIEDRIGYQEFAQILTEIEVEMLDERTHLSQMAPGREKELRTKLLAGGVYEKLLEKVQSNPRTKALFKKIQAEKEKELKGKVNSKVPSMYYLRTIAGLSAMIAYLLIPLCRTFMPLYTYLITVFTGIFIVGQSICLLFDTLQTINDVMNEKFSKKAKLFSVLKTATSIALLVVTIVTLISPVFSLFFLPILTALFISQIAFSHLYHVEIKYLSKFYAEVSFNDNWIQQYQDAQSFVQELESQPGIILVEKWLNLVRKRDGESFEMYNLRLEEMQKNVEWLQMQEKANKMRLLNPDQQRQVNPMLERFNPYQRIIPLMKYQIVFAKHVHSRCQEILFSLTRFFASPNTSAVQSQ